MTKLNIHVNYSLSLSHEQMRLLHLALTGALQTDSDKADAAQLAVDIAQQRQAYVAKMNALFSENLKNAQAKADAVRPGGKDL